MAYQFLTVHMFKTGKKNNGYIDQRLFKTADRYVFDSIVLYNTCIAILDGYDKYIRPLLQQSCSYLLANRNGKQFCKLTDSFSILMFEAIGKYVNKKLMKIVSKLDISTTKHTPPSVKI